MIPESFQRELDRKDHKIMELQKLVTNAGREIEILNVKMKLMELKDKRRNGQLDEDDYEILLNYHIKRLAGIERRSKEIDEMRD